ncbi:MAG: DUF4214 domain-containing protein, partial [Nitrosopumilaceae archaeon]
NLGFEKYDVVSIGDLERFKDHEQLLKKLRSFLDNNGYIVCSVSNIAHISARIKMLNGDIKYESSGIFDKNHLHFFTLDMIQLTLDVSGYRLVELRRVKEEFDLIRRTDLKHYTTPEELVRSILKDPEATTLQYVFKAIPTSHSDSSIRSWLMEFPRGITTQKLKEIFEHYKDQITILQKQIQEKDEQLKSLQKQIQDIHDSSIWRMLHKFDSKSKKTVDDLYREILRRPADEIGLQHYASMLESGKMTVDDIRKALLESDEYKRQR